MMAEVLAEFWFARALSSGRRFLDPSQFGCIRMLDAHKAWSPARSSGDVARLGADMSPLFSQHIRANGARHGFAWVPEHQRQVLIACKGADCIVTRGHLGTEGA
jgi:hypothetical protein